MRDGLIDDLVVVAEFLAGTGMGSLAGYAREAIEQLEEAGDVQRRHDEDRGERAKLPDVVIPPKWHRDLAERVLALEEGGQPHGPTSLNAWERTDQGDPLIPGVFCLPGQVQVGDVITGPGGRERVASKVTDEDITDSATFSALVATDGHGNDVYRTIRTVHLNELILCWPKRDF